MKCKYPKWAIDKVLQKQENTSVRSERDQSSRTNQTGRNVTTLYHTQRAYVKATKPSVASMVFRYILKEEYLEEPTNVPKRQR